MNCDTCKYFDSDFNNCESRGIHIEHPEVLSCHRYKKRKNAKQEYLDMLCGRVCFFGGSRRAADGIIYTVVLGKLKRYEQKDDDVLFYYNGEKGFEYRLSYNKYNHGEPHTTLYDCAWIHMFPLQTLLYFHKQFEQYCVPEYDKRLKDHVLRCDHYQMQHDIDNPAMFDLDGLPLNIVTM